MKNYANLLQTGIILLIIGMNSYALGNGLRLGSFWGIMFSLASFGALFYCIHLFKKLKQAETEEDYDNNY